MSGGTTALWVAAAAAAVSAGVSYQNGQEQKKAQSNALNQQRQAQSAAEKQAKEQADLADQQLNKTNPKRPDTTALLSSAEQAAKGGQSGTMLTGPTGIDPGALALGKSTLLGQ
jgi:L-serine deaminase